MQLPSFQHLQPGSLDEALGFLAEYGERARVIAGGTELLVSMKQRLLVPEYLVNLKALPELDYIRQYDGGLRIGALTTLSALIRSSAVGERFPILAQAARMVSAPPLQEMGTVGGNLCLNTRCFYYNQSSFWRQTRGACYKTGGDVCHVVEGGKRCFSTYQGDMAPALIALGATVEVVRKGGQREIPLAELYTGKGKRPVALEPNEIVVELRVPVSMAGAGGDYQKLRYRGSMDFPLAGVAAVLSRNGSGACARARVVLTAVGTGPVVVDEATRLLEGQQVNEKLVAQAADAAYEAARPVDNVGSDASYRRKMVRVLTRRAMVNAWGKE
ncbi:MAG: FAD binding domain-containing protein [Anaerolineae bacterium]